MKKLKHEKLLGSRKSKQGKYLLVNNNEEEEIFADNGGNSNNVN